MTSAEPSGLRSAAIEWLQMRTDGGIEPLTRNEVLDFHFDSNVFRLQSTQQGIRRPQGFSAALSFQTVFRRPGQERPYEDSTGSDGLFRYKWRGSNPDHPENQGLREAMRQHLPLIWFHGIAMNPARFQVITPVYIVAEERDQQQFVFTAAEDANAALSFRDSVHESVAKRYFERQAKVRVHQPVFRSIVLSAYENRCTVCSLAHPGLLDAAHIVPDHDEHGIASVVNGLAMCKIHHAAFDGNFLGIRPDCTVEIRHDLLEEVDGPMLRHGLQELHGKKLMKLPRYRRDRPDKCRLEKRYAAFESATMQS